MDYQQVYASSAFSGPMTITSVDFYRNTSGGGSGLVIGGSYSVYLSTTSAAVNGLNGTNLTLNRGPDWTKVGTVVGGTDTNPMLTIATSPFNYNPANGNLLFELIVTQQLGFNGGMEADGTGLVTSRAASFSTPIPEPGTLLMFASGIIGFVGVLRRKLIAA